MVALVEESLDGGFVLDQGDDDLAVAGRLLRLDDDEVAVEDAGLLHRVSAHGEDEVGVVATGDARDVDVLLDVLLGDDRTTGRDGTDQRQAGVASEID